MKKITILLLSVLACSCSHEIGNYGSYVDVDALKDKDPNEVTREDIQANAANIFGTIDPNQDWNLVSGGKVTITADADLDDVVKVQVLTEAPFFNEYAEILAEANVTKGEKVTLTYDAPNGYTSLVAACKDSQGFYYVKRFDIGATDVSFAEASMARTRGGESEDFGFLNNVQLPVAFSSPSFNAIRTMKANEGEIGSSNNSWQHIDYWKNSGWENERVWRIAPNNAATNGTWSLSVINGKNNDWEKIDGIRKTLSGGISQQEKDNLNTIFTSILRPKGSQNKEYNNLVETIMKSNIFNLENNNLTSTGKPLTIIPVQKFSTETSASELYYYYYDPSMLNGKTSAEQAQFIRELPKFKALKNTEVGTPTDDTGFFRDYEYLLPYYGDVPLIDMETLSDYQSDGKLYHIKNGFQVDNLDYYFCFQASSPQARVLVQTEMENSNLAGEGYWLWKVYKNAEGKCFLYNVGARTFVYFRKGKQPGNNNPSWTLLWTPDNYLTSDVMPFQLKEQSDGSFYIMRTDEYNSKGLGSDLNKYVTDRNKADNRGVWADKNSGDMIKWYFEEYTGDRKTELSVNTPTEIKQAKIDYVTAKSAVIPVGYKVGFLIKKNKAYENTWRTSYYNWQQNGFADTNPYTNDGNGELYGDARLNQETNHFGIFYSPVKNKLISTYDYPRIAMFTANGKSYLTFEEGSDLNFNDFIVEVSDGVKKVADDYGTNYIAFTMCFEDRPIADYDLNDCVLKFSRLSPSEVSVSLVACGANDELYLRGLKGQKLNETTEIHKIFGVDDPKTFINTDGSVTADPVSEVFPIDPTMRLSDFIETIYIYDATIDSDIKLSGLGDSPHAIVVPADFEYPKERQCINKAYPLFQNWVQNAEVDRYWFRNAIEQYTYSKK